MNAPLSLNQLKAIIRNPVELDARLKPFVEQLGEDHTAIKHPMIVEPQCFPAFNKIYNLRFEAALKARDEAFKQQDWEIYIYAHERAYWLEQFDSVKGKLSDGEYWRILGEIITDCENLWQYKALLHRLLSSPRSNRATMMRDDEKKAFSDLPDEMVVYRGYPKGGNKSGWDWTLSKAKAEWHARRYTKNPVLATGQVNKRDVIACFITNGGNDVLVRASNVKSKRASAIDPVAA